METRLTKHFFVLIGLLGLTSLALAWTVDVSPSFQAGILTKLPSKVQTWEGRDVHYCQARTCRRAVLADPGKDETTCSYCQGPTDLMSLSEKGLLPADTVALKKQYEIAAGHTIYASLVMSGAERGSIHRPEVCLRGQGRRLVNSLTLDVPIEGRENLKVRVLNLMDATRLPDGRQGPELESYYAYWFVGKDRETESHFERIFWMGFDRIFKNVSHRWAYLAVGGGRQPGSDQHLEEIKGFIRDFYPQMQLPKS